MLAPIAGEPVVTPAQPALHDEGTVRDGRQRPDLLGHQHRVPQRQQEQAPGRRLAPFREKPPEDRRVLIVGRGRHVLIADKQGIERGTAGRRGPLDHPARSLARIFHVRVIARERDPDLHCVILVAAQASIRPELADQAKDRLRLRHRAGGILVLPEMPIHEGLSDRLVVPIAAGPHHRNPNR